MRPLLVLAASSFMIIAACTRDDDGDPTAAPATTAAPTTRPTSPAADFEPVMETFAVPIGSHPHDVAPAADGGVWYTAQASGELGWLDPATG